MTGSGWGSPLAVCPDNSYDALSRALHARLSPADRVRTCVTLDDSLAWAMELGLRGGLQDLEAADELAWAPGATAAERELWAEQQRDAAHRAAHSHAPSYRSQLNTTLHWVALWRMRFPHRVMFLPLHDPATHASHASHNMGTLTSLRQFIESHGSLAKGRAGAATSAQAKDSVISTLRAFRSTEAQYDVGDPTFSRRFAAVALEARRRSTAPASERAISNGIRNMHLAQLHALGHRLSEFDHCLAHTCLQMVARGGEPGVRDKDGQASWRPDRGVAITDVVWRTAAESQSTLPSFDLFWYPAKDGRMVYRKIPIPVSRRRECAPGADPACPYDAMAAWWVTRSNELTLAGVPLCPPGCKHAGCPRSREPLFKQQGRIVDTTYVEQLGQRVAKLLGIEHVGGKWARIGGATDLMDALGPALGEAALRQRGRWARDMGQIYARVSAAWHLHVSRRMTESRGADLSQRAEWAQPTFVGR